MPLRTAAAAAMTLAIGLPAAACGSDVDRPATAGERLKVATTVAPITSLVASVAGDRADVEGIVPEGADSHTFEPKPSVAALLADADVVFVNGLGLEEATIRLAAENRSGGDRDVVELGAMAIPESGYIYDSSFPEKDGRPNPHLWTDPGLARRYAGIARDELSERDPANATYFAANYGKLSAVIDELDQAMRASFATIPHRKLLTYHDAYPYFARTYGWRVIGAIQVSDFEDPTPSEVAALIEQVKSEGVPAIFGSEVFPSPVLEQIGREAGVRYVDELRDDDLPGRPGDKAHSWLGLMRSNYITMAEALGGDAGALRAIEPAGVAPGSARYPQ